MTMKYIYILQLLWLKKMELAFLWLMMPNDFFQSMFHTRSLLRGIPVITCKKFCKEIIENKTNYTPLWHSSTLINGLRCHQITCAGAETEDPKIDQLRWFLWLSSKNVLWESITLKEEPENCLWYWIFKILPYKLIRKQIWWNLLRMNQV